MNVIPVQDRNGKLGEYLEHLLEMAYELERSMQAISENSLEPLEDSVANQQVLATRLRQLAEDLAGSGQIQSAAYPTLDDENLMSRIRGAAAALENLNARYAALLKLSSHSVGVMISMYSSFRGQIQGGAGPRLKQQTWSCQA